MCSAVACSLGSLSYRAELLSTRDLTWLSISIYTFRQAQALSFIPTPTANRSNPPSSAAEISAGIVCGCMPVLAPLFRDNADKRFRFPSLRYFSSRFASRSSRRPFISDNKIRSPDPSLPSERTESSEQEVSGSYMELESGTYLTKSNRTL